MHSGSEEVLDAPLDRPRDEGEDRTNLIVNYLPQAMTDNELYSMFITCGPLVSAKIMRDRTSGYSYGYGFVQYQNPEDAAKALTTLSGLPVSNKRIKVSYSRPNTADIRDTNLYVGNIPPGITEEDLVNLFAPYGNVLTRNLLKDQSGKNKGIAFIRFSKKSEAEDAIRALNGYTIQGATHCLDVKVAEDHGRQKAAFYAGYSVGAQEMVGHDSELGTIGWRGGRGGRGRGGGGRGGGLPPSYPQDFSSAGYGFGFAAQNGASRGGNRFNPISRGGGGVRGGTTNGTSPMGGFAGGFTTGGGRGGNNGGGSVWGFTRGGGRGGSFGDDSVGWNWISSPGSAETPEPGKGDGLLPIPSHIYTGEPLLYQCKAEPPPPSFSPLPPALITPDLIFPPLYHHHQQALELGSQGLFNSYQYYQVLNTI